MFRHLILLLVLALIWSSSFVAIKIGVTAIPPLTLATARIALAAVVLTGFVWSKGDGFPRDLRFWAFCFLLGVIGNALPFTMIGWGEQRIDSGLAAILLSVIPLSTVVMAHFFTAGDRMTPAKLVGVAVGFCGVVILVGVETLKDLGGDVWHQLAVVASAFCFAIAVILIRNMPPASLVVRSAAVMIAASLVMVPVAFVMDAPWTLRPSPGALAAAGYLGLFPTAIGTILFFHLVQAKGASYTAFIAYLVPVFGVVWGAVALGERLTVPAGVALLVILAGFAIAQFTPRSDNKDP